MSRSRPSRVPKPRGKKSKRVSQTARRDNLEPEVQEGGVLNHFIFDLAEGAVILEPQVTFNRAVVAITHDGLLVYSEKKIIEAFMSQGMDEEEATEFYEYNTLRALPYVPQEARPIIIRTA